MQENEIAKWKDGDGDAGGDRPGLKLREEVVVSRRGPAPHYFHV